MYKYEDVKNITTEEYFNNNQFSIDAFKKKYALTENETYIQAIKRVCDFIASVETTSELQTYWAERWFDEIYDDWWHPAGSIMQGANSHKKISISNCSTSYFGTNHPEQEWDNLESIIGNVALTVAKSAAYRQGQGICFDRLRPIGTTVQNSANESTGPIHWMKFIDEIANFVGQKGRIPALHFALSCKHPSVIDFIKSKADLHSIQNANISVHCTNDFYNAVINNQDWEMKFEIPEVKIGEKIYIDVHSTNKDSLKDENGWYYIAKKNRKKETINKTIKAKDLLILIAKYMTTTAEPGIQNIDIARKYSNSDYVYNPNDEYDSRICSSNACSEQYLSRDSLCVLSSINCERFSTDPIVYEQELARISPSILRFLDNVNECELKYNTYATPFQRLAIEKLRRCGAGLTSIAGWLFKAGFNYGEIKGNKTIGKFIERYNYYLYKTSIELGKEKGNFGLFDKEKFEHSPFIQGMMKLGLKFDTMRNCNCSSIAPCGTLSRMFRTLLFSSGVEPTYYGLYYWQRTRISGSYEYYFCVPSIIKKLFKDKGFPIKLDNISNNEIPDTIKDTWDGKIGLPISKWINDTAKKLDIQIKKASEINPIDKLNLISELMKSIDSSISTTFLLPENALPEDTYNFILEAWKKEVKSLSAFPDKKMYGIISDIPFKDLAIKLLEQNINIHQTNFSEEEQKELQKYNKKDKTNKRPKELRCDVHHCTTEGKQYFVLVGLDINGNPYEVFAGRNSNISKKIKTGKIIRKRKNFYKAIFEEDDTEISPIVNLMSSQEEAITRLISLSLRNKVDLTILNDQLEKCGGQDVNIHAFSKVIARVLRKYIQNGTELGDCPLCKIGKIIKKDGCSECSNCGEQKCS